MKYYVYYDESGRVIGLNATDGPVGSSAVEVTQEAFIAAGGDVMPDPTPVPDPITEIQLAVAELAQTAESNNTANQLAIAELAEIMTGGAANG